MVRILPEIGRMRPERPVGALTNAVSGGLGSLSFRADSVLSSAGVSEKTVVKMLGIVKKLLYLQSRTGAKIRPMVFGIVAVVAAIRQRKDRPACPRERNRGVAQSG